MATAAGELNKRITIMAATLQSGSLADKFTYAERKKVWAKSLMYQMVKNSGQAQPLQTFRLDLWFAKLI